MENKIYELLSDKTKQMVDEQISYLGAKDSDKFRDFHEGAQTVLDILKIDPIFELGTTNWLKVMDSGQLEFAIKKANEMLKEKKSRGKVLIYGVHSSHGLPKFFLERAEANKHFIEIAAVEAEVDRYPELSIDKRKIDIDELGEYGLEEVKPSAGPEN